MSVPDCWSSIKESVFSEFSPKPRQTVVCSIPSWFCVLVNIVCTTHATVWAASVTVEENCWRDIEVSADLGSSLLQKSALSRYTNGDQTFQLAPEVVHLSTSPWHPVLRAHLKTYLVSLSFHSTLHSNLYSVLTQIFQQDHPASSVIFPHMPFLFRHHIHTYIHTCFLYSAYKFDSHYALKTLTWNTTSIHSALSQSIYV